MPADPSEAARGALSPLQRTRVDSARAALQGARAADLAALDAEQLILLVERLRGRLGDVLGLLSDFTSLSCARICAPYTASAVVDPAAPAAFAIWP